LLGLTSGETQFAERDVDVNPSTLDQPGLEHYGITRRMPASFQEAMEALREDGALNEALAPGLVGDYLGMKREEARMLEGMGEMERRVFLVERY
jgi:glutamine synthetase